MTTSTTGPELTENLEPLARIVERLLVLTERSRSTALIHAALQDALQSAHDGEDDTPHWMRVLQRALQALGVRASRMKMPASSAMSTVGPQQPVALSAGVDGQGEIHLMSDTRPGLVLIETPSTGEQRWMNLAQLNALAPMMAMSGQWLAVDAPLELGSGTGADAHHGGNHPTPQQRLRTWMRAEKHDLGAILVYALFLGVFTLTLPVAAQALVSTVAFGTLLQPLVVLTALLLGALVFSGTLRAAQTYVVEIVQRRIFLRVVADLSYRLPRVTRAALDRKDGPELVNRFFDTFTVQKSAATLLLDGLEITLTVLVGMLVLAFYHPLLLGLDIVLVLLVGGIVVGLGRRGTKTAIDESYRKYEMAAWLEELARHDALFKLGGGLRYAELRAEDLAGEYLDKRKKHFAVVFRQTIAVLALQAMANAAVLGLGGWLVIGRQLTLGQLVAAELIVTTVVASIAKVGKYLESYYDLIAAIDKLGHLTDLPLERVGGDACADVGLGGRGATLSIEHVAGGYAGGATTLKDVSLTVAAGARVAIAGSTGAGKSLFVEMLSALRDPVSGRIVIDGHDLRDVDLASFRRKIAVVRSEVISGSILENVRLGRSHVDTRAVREALATVGMLDDVDAMPEGIHTVLNAMGEPLSASQKMRLAIARSIAGAPSLLVLDDATDGLDPRVREPMLDKLFDAAQPWTLIVVSNDSRIHKRCETVWRLNDGTAEMWRAEGRN
jgi:ABC-type bacteriocin/lantibiotic exporter with double-glycine peptidase domain